MTEPKSIWKQCKTCEAFFKRRQRKEFCEPCAKKRQRRQTYEWRERNPERVREIAKKQHEKRRHLPPDPDKYTDRVMKSLDFIAEWREGKGDWEGPI